MVDLSGGLLAGILAAEMVQVGFMWATARRSHKNEWKIDLLLAAQGVDPDKVDPRDIDPDAVGD